MTVRASGREIGAVVPDVDGVLLDTASGCTHRGGLLRRLLSVGCTPQIAAGTHGVGLAESTAVLTAGPPDVYHAATARLGVPPAPIPRAVGTVRSHRDLLLRLGLLPPADTDREERP